MIYIFLEIYLLLRLLFIIKNFFVFVFYNIILNLIIIIGNFEIFVCVCYFKYLKEV